MLNIIYGKYVDQTAKLFERQKMMNLKGCFWSFCLWFEKVGDGIITSYGEN